MRRFLLVVLVLSLGCGEDVSKKTPVPEPMEDMNTADMNTADMNTQEDMSGDFESDTGTDGAEDMSNPCDLVDCGQNAECLVVEDQAICECLEGFELDGQDCVPENEGPTLQNLPAEESGARSESDSFTITATDPNPNDVLTFGLVDSTCPFDVQVVAATGVVTWNCPATTLSCGVNLQVKDDSGLTDVEALTIHCVRSLPVISSTPPTMVDEHETLSYDVQCQDPEGSPVTISRAADDTCGGIIQTNRYVFTPGETDGGNACLLKIQCSNGETIETQSSTLSIQETNEPPSHVTLPTTASAPWGRAGSIQLAGADSDIPQQSLEFTRLSSTCSYNVDVSLGGAVSFLCQNSTGTCSTQIRVSDGLSAATSTLTTACTNAAPSASNVSVSPAQPSSPGALLTCSYTFADPDSDADQSTLQWYLNGSPTGVTSSTFSAYGEGDEVQCRVTPSDGISSGTTRLSNIVVGPLQPFVRLGEAHACARTAAGGVKCWGNNFYGKVGGPDLSGNTYYAPYTPGNLTSGVTLMDVGNNFSCAVHNGTLKCWGSAGYGLLGTALQGAQPNPVSVLSGGITQIAAGSTHVCVVQNGAVKCWGGNAEGQSGNTSTYNATEGNPYPTTVSGMTSGITKVVAGSSHTCAIKSGALYCWGNNYHGQLGLSTNFQTDNMNASPSIVSGMSSGVTDVVAGALHTCAEHNGVWKCWGFNQWSQLGRTTTSNFNYLTGTVAADMSGAGLVRAGGDNVCFLDSGSLNCWGSNSWGQLLSPTSYETIDSELLLPSGVTDVGIGRQAVCAVENGQVYCWGSDYNAISGGGQSVSAYFPKTLINL